MKHFAKFGNAINSVQELNINWERDLSGSAHSSFWTLRISAVFDFITISQCYLHIFFKMCWKNKKMLKQAYAELIYCYFSKLIQAGTR